MSQVCHLEKVRLCLYLEKNYDRWLCSKGQNNVHLGLIYKFQFSQKLRENPQIYL